MRNTATQSEIAALIDATKGKFFSLTFAKKDGTIRTINAKDRFTGLIKGTGSPATDALRQGGYMFAVDRNKNSYFCFKPEKVLALKCGKIDKEFSIVVDWCMAEGGGVVAAPLKFYAKSGPKMRKFFHQLLPNETAYLSGAYLQLIYLSFIYKNLLTNSRRKCIFLSPWQK